MMAESAKTPFDSPDWIFEIKLDGYRAITVFDSAGKPHLWSRNGLPLEAKFPAVAPAVSKLKLRSTILDGEVVAVDANGIPRFQLLQRFQKQPTAPTLYYVFDVLWYNGDDLTGHSILERRKVLERVVKPREGVQIGSYVEAEGKALFQLTKEKGMEGSSPNAKTVFTGPENERQTGSRSKRGCSRSLSLVDLRRPKEAGSIWVLSCLVPTRMVNSATMATRAPASARKA